MKKEENKVEEQKNDLMKFLLVTGFVILLASLVYWTLENNQVEEEPCWDFLEGSQTAKLYNVAEEDYANISIFLNPEVFVFNENTQEEIPQCQK